MSKYEDLIMEFELEVEITEQDMGNKGFYGDGTIWISNRLGTEAERACILAEEIGHYKTSAGDIIDQTKIENTKQEHKARTYAYEKLIPLQDLKDALSSGCRNMYELADHLGVTEEFCQNTIEHYQSKYGPIYHILYVETSKHKHRSSMMWAPSSIKIGNAQNLSWLKKLLKYI